MKVYTGKLVKFVPIFNLLQQLVSSLQFLGSAEESPGSTGYRTVEKQMSVKA